jgi:hypothetical protein
VSVSLNGKLQPAPCFHATSTLIAPAWAPGIRHCSLFCPLTEVPVETAVRNCTPGRVRSSSISVTVPRPLSITPPADALLSWTKKTASCIKVGLHSSIVSPLTCTLMFCGRPESIGKVSVPLAIVKSAGALAVPATNVQSTVIAAGGGPATVTGTLMK